MNKASLRARWDALAAVDGISARQQVWVLLAVIAVLFLRRIDDLIAPQFSAEDGTRFFAQAYNLGWWHALALPNAGYMDSFPRLAASLALVVPFRWAPLVMNVCGAICQALPANALLSHRCRTWGPLNIRAAMAVVYVLMTNTSALHIVATNSPWHLTILALLLAFADPPKRWWWRVSDCVVFLVAGTSGPYSILMAPVMIVHAMLTRKRWHMVGAAIITLSGICEAAYVLVTPRGVTPVLGASLMGFLRILGADVFLNAIIGASPTAKHLPAVLIVLLFAGGVAILVYGNLAATRPLRLFTAFAYLLLAASLLRPLMNDQTPAWQMLLTMRGGRYYYLPIVAFVWALLWAAAKSSSERVRKIAIAGVCILPIGIAHDLIHPRALNYHFPEHARQVEEAPAGQILRFEIDPGGWIMEIHKR